MSQPRLDKSTSFSLPLTGAYFWFPRLAEGGHTWELITCHDLRVWDGISHREFWPYVVKQLAKAWSKEPEVLKRQLRDHYTGLPRGRITHPKSGYLIIHGNDAPVKDWKAEIKTRFRLPVKITALFDEHERMLREDLRALQEALGVSLDLVKTV